VERSRLGKELRTYGLTYADSNKKFQLVLGLYNDAWADNWNSIPVSPAEGKWITGLVLPVSKPAWARIAEWRGEPVAIVSQIPDVNKAMADLDGRLMPFGWAKLMWRIHIAGTKRSRVPMIGVAKKWRGTRVGSLAVSMVLAQAIDQAKAAGIEDMEISWMLETNHAVLNLVESLPAKVTRKLRVYEKRCEPPSMYLRFRQSHVALEKIVVAALVRLLHMRGMQAHITALEMPWLRPV
jgi:GNAT superfamily N-acetyltransferase